MPYYEKVFVCWKNCWQEKKLVKEKIWNEFKFLLLNIFGVMFLNVFVKINTLEHLCLNLEYDLWLCQNYYIKYLIQIFLFLFVSCNCQITAIQLVLEERWKEERKEGDVIISREEKKRKLKKMISVLKRSKEPLKLLIPVNASSTIQFRKIYSNSSNIFGCPWCTKLLC